MKRKRKIRHWVKKQMFSRKNESRSSQKEHLKASVISSKLSDEESKTTKVESESNNEEIEIMIS